VKERWEDPRGSGTMGVKVWKRLALEMDKWKKTVEEAKA
jgi:hypothetical protein